VELTKLQRNRLYKALVAGTVDPADCEMEEVGRRPGDPVRIVHRPTKSAFVFGPAVISDGVVTAFNVQFHVPNGLAGQPRSAQCTGWSELQAHVGAWAAEIREVSETPDLWAELRNAPKILAGGRQQGASNTPFTSAELAEISTRLDQANDVVRRENPDLTGKQLAAIQQTLAEVKEAATRVGRKDWVMMANGALLSLIVNDVVPAHVVQGVFSVLLTGIGHIFGIGVPPPAIIT
jgi:hypothetical protein